MDKRRVLITGADGFIGKNLYFRLLENSNFTILTFTRKTKRSLYDLILESEIIVHLAGVNRPNLETEFETANIELTEEICNFIFKKFKKTKQKTRIILASSTHAENSSVYGKSKLKAEKLVINLNDKLEQVAAIYRFPGFLVSFANQIIIQ